ncbi:MAG TPA: phosphotransferase [Dehalococcoidia bacterium]|nr:phosphotransferase [Dehalococcoidia bacterium]
MSDLEAVERALTAWDRGARIVEPLGGNRNRLWRVRLASLDCVARRSVRPRPAVEWELELLEFLHRSGLRVCAPVRTSEGARMVDGIVLLRWLEGEPPASERDWRLVAETLRTLHRLTRAWPQRPGFCSAQELLTGTAGGDVDLALMPPDAVELCRAAWRALAGEPLSVVHGDPCAANIRIAHGEVGLLDWDEARVDVSALDFADLPIPPAELRDPGRAFALRRAADAWEAAAGWRAEPAYARRRLARLSAETGSHA